MKCREKPLATAASGQEMPSCSFRLPSTSSSCDASPRPSCDASPRNQPFLCSYGVSHPPTPHGLSQSLSNNCPVWTSSRLSRQAGGEVAPGPAESVRKAGSPAEFLTRDHRHGSPFPVPPLEQGATAVLHCDSADVGRFPLHCFRTGHLVIRQGGLSPEDVTEPTELPFPETRT